MNAVVDSVDRYPDVIRLSTCASCRRKLIDMVCLSVSKMRRKFSLGSLETLTSLSMSHVDPNRERENLAERTKHFCNRAHEVDGVEVGGIGGMGGVTRLRKLFFTLSTHGENQSMHHQNNP